MKIPYLSMGCIWTCGSGIPYQTRVGGHSVFELRLSADWIDWLWFCQYDCERM